MFFDPKYNIVSSKSICREDLLTYYRGEVHEADFGSMMVQ